MKLAIFSDIHGNLPCLESAIKDLKSKGIDAYFFLGDVVNYGPWSNECVEFIDTLENSQKIMGNHEEYFINKKCNVKNQLVKNFYKFCIKDFKRFDLIKKYKNKINFENIIFTHTIGKKYIYEDTAISLKKNTVIGHSHSQYFRKEKKFWILNPGSLGQNRKAINKMQYAILNTKNTKVQLMTKKYNPSALINKMKKLKYPKDCLEYYLKKIR